MKPTREPVAVSVGDRAAPVQLAAGMKVIRRPIFQARYGQEDGWGKELVDRITVAKSLGFTLFEIDVTNVKVDKPNEAAEGMMYISIFGTIAQEVIEGEEWKGKEDKKKALRKDCVITVYALVVE